MIAVQSLLEALKPAGDIKNPFSPELIDEAMSSVGETNAAFITLMKNAYASPENWAAHNFAHLWTVLQRDHPLSDRELEVIRGGGRVGEMIREEFYGLQDARNDLQWVKAKEDAN